MFIFYIKFKKTKSWNIQFFFNSFLTNHKNMNVFKQQIHTQFQKTMINPGSYSVPKKIAILYSFYRKMSTKNPQNLKIFGFFKKPLQEKKTNFKKVRFQINRSTLVLLVSKHKNMNTLKSYTQKPKKIITIIKPVFIFSIEKNAQLTTFFKDKQIPKKGRKFGYVMETTRKKHTLKQQIYVYKLFLTNFFSSFNTTI
eukprot:TRINITY_DN12897_c0_g4_i1.p3 TRINITY_DN12897_c0_g4~~TRINITY_DN12897_c0_g4_i1.p3  ORF type:complete len:197 (+),score=4.66 TRINITY_DN12897_c0_g4_i1:364-954(+)